MVREHEVTKISHQAMRRRDSAFVDFEGQRLIRSWVSGGPDIWKYYKDGTTLLAVLHGPSTFYGDGSWVLQMGPDDGSANWEIFDSKEEAQSWALQEFAKLGSRSRMRRRGSAQEIAQEIARIEWLLTFEQPQERIDALQRDLAALKARADGEISHQAMRDSRNAARRRAMVRRALRRRAEEGGSPATDLGSLENNPDPVNGEKLEDQVERQDVTLKNHVPTTDEQESQYDETDYDNQGGKNVDQSEEAGQFKDELDNLKSSSIQALKLADLYLELGTITKQEKYQKVAEFERLPKSVLADRIKTAEEIITKLPKQAAQRTASGRVPKPSLAPRGMPYKHSSQDDSGESLLFF